MEGYYQREQRERRTRILIGGIAVTGIGVAIVVGVVMVNRDPYASESPEIPSVVVNTTTPVDSAVEFQLVVGSDTYDITPGREIKLRGGGKLELDATPTWLAGGDGYHFKHAKTVSVSPSADTMIASIDGAVLKLISIDAKQKDAEAKKLMSSMVTMTGQVVGQPEPTTRGVAGAQCTGQHYRTTTTMTVDTFVCPVGKLRLGVLLYRQDPRANLERFDDLLASLATGPGEPAPHFIVLGTKQTPLFVDQPAQLDAIGTVTVKRRPTVLRTVTGDGGWLTFEHPRGVSVARMPNNTMLAVAVQTDRTALQLFDLGMHFSIEELSRSLLGTVKATDLGEVRHTWNGKTLVGHKLRMVELPVDTEIFTFDRDGKSIGASLQYVAEDEKAATDLAVPIMMSVR